MHSYACCRHHIAKLAAVFQEKVPCKIVPQLVMDFLGEIRKV